MKKSEIRKLLAKKKVESPDTAKFRKCEPVLLEILVNKKISYCLSELKDENKLKCSDEEITAIVQSLVKTLMNIYEEQISYFSGLLKKKFSRFVFRKENAS